MNCWRPSRLRQLAQQQALREAKKELAVKVWVGEATQGDRLLGRGDHNWAEPPTTGMKPHLAQLKARGVTVYVGAGQLILADMKPANPILEQRRPLAQRRVQIFSEEATA